MPRNKASKSKLKDLLQKKVKQLGQEESSFTRVQEDSYKLCDDEFYLNEPKAIQYASTYFSRYELLMPALKEASIRKWDGCKIVDEIVSLKPEKSEKVIIGTLFKEMKLKPSVVLDMVVLLGRESGPFIEESDSLLLEDISGRMKILASDIMDPAKFVTGIVIALKGKININGFFEVSDYTLPGVPPINSLRQEETKFSEEKTLFSDLENRKFMAFVSGMEFGNITQKIPTTILSQFLSGNYGSKLERLLNSRVARIVIAGNHIAEESDIDEVIKGSFRTHDINEKVYTNISGSIEQFECFVKAVSQVCELDIIPGDNDIAGAFLPQQPPNVALFPQLLKNDNIVFSTNPHQFEINGKKFLGTSGQNIKDICRFRDMKGKTECDILCDTLQMRHIAPTCPDTLRSFPFISNDPLVIKECPNVYFSCNAEEFGTKLDKEESEYIRCVTVPSFSKTSEIVFLDLDSLEVYSYKIAVERDENHEVNMDY